jgi:hypothetical protein
MQLEDFQMRKLGRLFAVSAFLALVACINVPHAQATSYTELTPIIAQDDDPPAGGSTCNDANEDGECDSSDQE